MVVLGGGAVYYERGTPVRRDFLAEFKELSVTVSVGIPLCTYDIASQRVCGLFAHGGFEVIPSKSAV